jgi:(R,R)-butanediol dehydrogenase / meso-butanediol dehydrogenase / diacetyl reductase
MKAVTYEGADKLMSVKDLPVPEPGPGELLLKVAACGICGSDLHAYQASLVAEGNAFGHEFAGEVTAVGEGVGNQWQVGDRATALGAMVCGQCEKCQQGLIAQCENIELIGFSRHGAYADYVITQAAGSVHVPENMDYSQAALVEPLAVGLAAYRDCQLPLGGNILVIGAGIIGLTVVKWARFFGAENVVISDLDPARLERASLVGATACIDAREHADTAKAFKDLTGTAPDVIVECVGRPMLQQLVDIAPHSTHIVSVGAAMEPDSIAPWTAAEKKIRLTFSFGYELEDFQFIVRMISAGRMDTEHLISRTVSLDEVPETFAGLMQANGHCKVMITP